MNRKFLLIVITVLLYQTSFSQDKPNILWLTCEDMTDFYLSCYGNTTIETPNLDSFAARGLRFTHAYSNGAQCSPARNTLVTGCYAPSVGADWHRNDRALPVEKFWTPILTDSGYYCASKGKMRDYNSNNVLPNDLWNEGKSYTNAPVGKPWFSILNYYETHMSRVTDNPIDKRTNRTIAKADVNVPGYVPDIDWIRDDLAWHLEFVKKLDVWFGNQLQALEDAGQADNTIIFFFSDHGGSLPNSKGYLNNGGTHVPFIVYFPEKWKHLAPVSQPAVIDDLVGFVDFGPTVLSLAGIDPAEQFQGKAFMGEHVEGHRDYIYLYKANQAPNYIPSRAITNGKIKFIWNYNTAFVAGSRQGFQWKMPGYRGWEQAFINGTLNDPYNDFWNPYVPFELYDLENDLYEANNLVNDPNWSDTLVKYKAILKQTIRDNKDLGFFPQSMRNYNSTTDIFHDWVRDTDYDLEMGINAAEFASTAEASDVDSLEKLLHHDEAVVRFWGSLGFFQLAKRGKIDTLPAQIDSLFNNEQENVHIRCNCASARIYLGDYCKPLDYLLSLLKKGSDVGRTYLHSIEDYAAPIARDIYNFMEAGNKGFYNRSVLINTGAIPYKYLLSGNYNPDLDESVFDYDTLRYDCPVDTSVSLIFHYPFDGNLQDASPASHQLTASNGSNFSTGKKGEALLLNGIDQYFDLKTTGLLNPSTDGFTICAWVYNTQTEAQRSNLPDAEILLHQLGARVMLQHLILENGDFTIGTWTGGASYLAAGNAFETNKWQHIALVGDPNTQELIFYVNGRAVDTQKTANVFEHATGGVRIGAHKNGTEAYWHGKIDELYLFKGKLSADSIYQMGYNPLSIHELTKLNNYTIQPNPTRKQFTVIADGHIEKIHIFQINGSEISKYLNTQKVDISNLAKGCYIVKVKFKNGGIATKKLIVN